MYLLAYIDPNAGSLLWQVLVAGLVGSLLYFRDVVWHLATLRFLIGKQSAEGGQIDD